MVNQKKDNAPKSSWCKHLC